jgi:hypothetical protein
MMLTCGRPLLTQVYDSDHEYFYITHPESQNILHSANECRLLLLHAGADPTIGGTNSALCLALGELSKVSTVAGCTHNLC